MAQCDVGLGWVGLGWGWDGMGQHGVWRDVVGHGRGRVVFGQGRGRCTCSHLAAGMLLGVAARRRMIGAFATSLGQRRLRPMIGALEFPRGRKIPQIRSRGERVAAYKGGEYTL